MTWLIWNIRGVHQKESKIHLKELIRSHDVQFLILLEPKASHTELPRFAFNMGFHSWMHGDDVNSHVWILWKGYYKMHMLFKSSQAITLEVVNPDNQKVVISGVYASCLKRVRQELWSHLDDISGAIRENPNLWMVAGDFNVITTSSEKRGGQPLDMGAIYDFQNCISRNSLIDAGFIGEAFTWCNNRRGHNRIWERLDRVMFNLEAQNVFPTLSVRHLPRIESDHSPLLVRWAAETARITAGFIFQRMWTDHHDFKQVVATDWAKPMAGTPGIKFWRKLTRLKHTLKKWNWTVFGDISYQKKVLVEKIQHCELQLQGGWADQTHSEWDAARKELSKVETWEHELLGHKARMDWTKNGNRNSAFYHEVIKDRRKRQLIQLMRPDESITTDAREIERAAQNFFSKLFSASPYFMNQDLFDGINPRISDHDNEMFTKIPSLAEVKEAITQMNPSSSPGNDGFTGYFYLACWEIIESDLCSFIIDFFRGAYNPKEINSTTLVLISKVPEARQLGDFRPISLGNFSGKIISKILVLRLAKILPKIVDEEQAGFVQDRQISPHIAIAQELV